MISRSLWSTYRPSNANPKPRYRSSVPRTQTNTSINGWAPAFTPTQARITRVAVDDIAPIPASMVVSCPGLIDYATRVGCTTSLACVS